MLRKTKTVFVTVMPSRSDDGKTAARSRVKSAELADKTLTIPASVSASAA
jgi:hypothetical protein